MTEARGINGTVEFDGVTVSLTKRAPLMAKQGTKTYPISSIGAIQYKAATSLVNGYLQLSILGEVSKRNKRSMSGTPTRNIGKDENAIIFRKSSGPAFDAIVTALRAAHSTKVGPDLVSQLEGLARLLEQGILTEDEFAAKKTQLLA
jgi:hypothetical protein